MLCWDPRSCVRKDVVSIWQFDLWPHCFNTLTHSPAFQHHFSLRSCKVFLHMFLMMITKLPAINPELYYLDCSNIARNIFIRSWVMRHVLSCFKKNRNQSHISCHIICFVPLCICNIITSHQLVSIIDVKHGHWHGRRFGFYELRADLFKTTALCTKFSVTKELWLQMVSYESWVMMIVHCSSLNVCEVSPCFQASGYCLLLVAS